MHNDDTARLEVVLAQPQESKDFVLGEVIQLLLRNNRVEWCSVVRQKAECPGCPAVQVSSNRVLDLLGKRVDTKYVRVPKLAKQIDEVAGPATDDQDACLSIFGKVAQIIVPVERAKAPVAFLDFLGRFPKGVERLELGGERVVHAGGAVVHR